MKEIKPFSLFLIILSIYTISCQSQTANVYYSKISGKYTVKYEEKNKNALAYANYTQSFETQGWDYLTISSSDLDESVYSDYVKNYGMGYLEGYITYKRIYDHYRNMNNYKFYKNEGKMPDYIENFFIENIEYMRKIGIEFGDTDPYYHEVYNFYHQMKGIVDGYNNRVKEEKIKNLNLDLQEISLVHFMVIISIGDLDELEYLNKTNRPDYSKMETEEIINYVNERMHCSALIKAASDLSDVWFGHNTWTGYNKLIHMFKEYRYYPSKKFPVKAKVILVSGYPGSINSNDDFYITDANLYVAETTNNVFNTTLFDDLTPESLVCWIRTMIALRMSDNGKEWTQIFERLNSGTYNNQFHILDLNKIDTENKNISDGALYIIEQLPKYCGIADVTSYLRKGYWPSYNTPFIEKVRELSGVNDQIKQRPELYDSYDYSGCARANIFRREQSKVTNVDAYKKLMRYNDYENDPLSKGSKGNVISYRGDLGVNSTCFGAIDVKFASINDIKKNGHKKIYLINGPTYDQHDPFQWSTTNCKESNPLRFTTYGHVDKYKFEWIEYETELW